MEKSPQSALVDTEPVRSGSPFRKVLMSSMVVWFLVIFCACELVARCCFSIRDSTPYSTKLSNFFLSDGHPDVLLFGSSVAVSSAFESDSSLGLTKNHLKEMYYGAVQLGQSLEAKTGKKLSINNLAVFGAMTNNAWMCATKLVEFKKIPKVMIYETASRDFFDAGMPKSFESDYYRVMASMHPKNSSKLIPAPLMAVYDLIVEGTPLAMVQNLVFDEQALRNPDLIHYETDYAFGAISYIYHERIRILTDLTTVAMRLTNRESTFQFSSEKNQLENRKKNPFSKISSAPTSTFVVDSAPQVGRFAEEKAYFIKLLQVCRHNHIKLIIVNMPVTPTYDALVPTPLRPRWPSELESEAKKYGFEVLNLDDRNVFSKADFIDFAHLNKGGAVKLNELLAKEIARRGLFNDL